MAASVRMTQSQNRSLKGSLKASNNGGSINGINCQKKLLQFADIEISVSSLCERKKSNNGRKTGKKYKMSSLSSHIFMKSSIGGFFSFNSSMRADLGNSG